MVANKWMTVATVLSGVVRLEVRTFRDAADMATQYEVLYRDTIIGRMAVSDSDQPLIHNTFAL